MKTWMSCWVMGLWLVSGCASSSDDGTQGGNQALSASGGESSPAAAPKATPTCTAQSSVRGDIELQSKTHAFPGNAGIELTVKDQTKDPYFLTISFDASDNVTVILTDLKTNQSSGFDGGFGANGKLDATLMVRNATGDDIVTIACQK